MELYLLTESFVYEKTPNHNRKKNRSLGEGTKLTSHTPLMFGCFLELPETIVGLHSGGVGIVQSFFTLLNYVIGLLQLP